MINLNRLINSISVFYKIAVDCKSFIYDFFVRRGYTRIEVTKLINDNKATIDNVCSKYVKDVPKMVDSSVNSASFFIGKGLSIKLSLVEPKQENTYECGVLIESPKTFYCIEEYEPIEALNIQNPKLAHYSFLIDFLDIYGQAEWEEIEQFIDQNKIKINKIMRSFSHPPVMIGKGSDGMAFDIGDGLILKLFNDEYAYEKSVEAFNRLYDSPDLADTEIKLYDVGILGELGYEKIYYYIVEKVDTNILNKNVSLRNNMIDLTRSISRMTIMNRKEIANLRSKIYDKSYEQYVSGIINKETDIIHDNIMEYNKTIVDNINKDAKNYNLREDWLKSLIREIIVKYITRRTDLNVSNMGLTNYGHFRFFDPSYSAHTSEINA